MSSDTKVTRKKFRVLNLPCVTPVIFIRTYKMFNKRYINLELQCQGNCQCEIVRLFCVMNIINRFKKGPSGIMKEVDCQNFSKLQNHQIVFMRKDVRPV